MVINLPNQWTPRPDQLPLWSYLENGGRLACLIGHRRWGKDDVALHHTACALHERIGVFWHMLPEATQARKAIWEAINPRTGLRRIDEAFPRELRATTREDQMFIKFKCGSTWQVVGSDNFDSLVGSPPIGVVFSEWALADPRAWPYLRPILRENKGWALFITTPRGHNHAESTFKLAQENPAYFAQLITASQSGVFSPEDLEQERKELILEYGKEYGEAMFQQEYNCSFNAAIMGSYYGYLMEDAEREGRIGHVEYDEHLPVHTFWDLGVDDHMAIWFVQFAGREIRWIDYESGGGVALDQYIQIIRDKPYRYGQHYGPHDLRVRELTAGGISRIEYAAKQGINFKIVPELALEDGRQALRAVLPMSVFDKERCSAGISALQQHRAEWDGERRILTPKPYKDWTCHGADAARYCAVQWREDKQLSAVPFKRKEFLIESNGPGKMKSNQSILAYVQRKERERSNAD